MWSRFRQVVTAVSWSLLPVERRCVPWQAAVQFRATRRISETWVRRYDADVRNQGCAGDSDRSFGGPLAWRSSPFQKLRLYFHHYRAFSPDKRSTVATTTWAKWYSVFSVTRSVLITMQCILNTNTNTTVISIAPPTVWPMAQTEIKCFERAFETVSGTGFDVYSLVGSRFQALGAATEKSLSPSLRCVRGTATLL